MLHAITMYNGVWYATHKTVADTERKVNKNKDQVRKINWDAIIVGLILLACLVIGGI